MTSHLPNPTPLSNDHHDRPHILVINDEQALLDLFQELLEEEGYRVTNSVFVLDLSKIRDIAPDMIVLDIMFEGESKGWPFITMMRVDLRLWRIPMVLCTAAIRTVEPMLERLASQQVRVIYKPFDLDELLTAIADIRRGAFHVVE